MSQEQLSSHDTGRPDPLSVHMILVHRNRGTTGRRTIQRFLDEAAAADLGISMTVVDNGSAPEQLALLRDDLCLLYTSPSPRDGLLSRMPSSA